MEIRYIDWGDDSAEADSNLMEYFVDSTTYNLLKLKRKRIVVGRKGSGKSAIRKKLTSEFQNSICIEITPNENVIKSIASFEFPESMNNSEIAFQYVWLTYIYDKIFIELAKTYRGKTVIGSKEYVINYAESNNRYNKDLLGIFANLVNKISIKAGSLGDFGLNFEKTVLEITNVEEMEYHLLEVLDQDINVFIDDLDLGWDNSENSNNLLLGLLNVMNHLKKISNNIYPFLFIRTDMYKILMSKTQHSDKFRDTSYIKWDSNSLEELLTKRIKYNYNVNHEHIPGNSITTVFPSHVGKSLCLNWLFDRTLSRPRELIQFCKKYTEGLRTNEPNSQSLIENEKIYSEWKLEDVCNEFSNEYPKLQSFFESWKKENYRIKYHLKEDEFLNAVRKVFNELDIEVAWYKKAKTDNKYIFNILYEIGFLGDFILGGDGGSKTIYITVDDTYEPTFKEVQIHPCFRMAVGTRVRN